ncbi:MAG: hypothetical protein QNK37_28405 [Acidobacteriota bacterium]|nr:hypothetical protein [Acidobacteriota bacterium]
MGFRILGIIVSAFFLMNCGSTKNTGVVKLRESGGEIQFLELENIRYIHGSYQDNPVTIPVDALTKIDFLPGRVNLRYGFGPAKVTLEEVEVTRKDDESKFILSQVSFTFEQDRKSDNQLRLKYVVLNPISQQPDHQELLLTEISSIRFD